MISYELEERRAIMLADGITTEPRVRRIAPLSVMGRAALEYVNTLGWPIIPLFPMRNGRCSCGYTSGCKPGKHPLAQLVPHGVHDATLDAGTVLRWWSSWRDAGIGIAMGSGMWALDVDPRHGGDETLGALEREHGKLPHTVTAITGGDGAHYLFTIPDGFNVVASLGPGLECKGKGGYVVAAPTLHASGRRYAWDCGAHPLETPIADTPDWLARLACAAPRKPAGPPIGAAADSLLGRLFAANGWVGSGLDKRGNLMVCCPWSDSHSDDRGRGDDDSCVILPPTSEYPRGSFYCRHESGHGVKRTRDVLALFTAAQVDAAYEAAA